MIRVENYEDSDGIENRDSEVLGSNPGAGSNFSFEFKIVILQGTKCRFVFICQCDLKSNTISSNSSPR